MVVSWPTCGNKRKTCSASVKSVRCVRCGRSDNVRAVCHTWTMGPKYGDTGDTEICEPYCVCADVEDCKQYRIDRLQQEIDKIR
jgi:hypothetical protein